MKNTNLRQSTPNLHKIYFNIPSLRMNKNEGRLKLIYGPLGHEASQIQVLFEDEMNCFGRAHTSTI